ncbi:hypothetical protein LPBF_05570 [Flavobacterium crassostreae]|uniref:Uncharacterized protein n=1 Tax=Flavobacterium crassostreae TaxID=1763534 RepID=A0A1B9E4K6_9FLAO|nr:hypothetical protein LPBF_05570 [Flavobacterium crassostreae]
MYFRLWITIQSKAEIIPNEPRQVMLSREVMIKKTLIQGFLAIINHHFQFNKKIIPPFICNFLYE